MSLNSLFRLLVLSLFGVCSVQLGSGAGEMRGTEPRGDEVFVKMQVKKPRFNIGEPIVITVSVENRTKKPLRFWRRISDGKNGISSVQFSVRPKRRGRAINTNVERFTETVVRGGAQVLLDPGKTTSWKYYLNEWFYLSPGQYEVSVRLFSGVRNSYGADYLELFEIKGRHQDHVLPIGSGSTEKVVIDVAEDAVNVDAQAVERLRNRKLSEDTRLNMLRELAFTYQPVVRSLLTDLSKDKNESAAVREEAQRWARRYKRFEALSGSEKQ